MYESYWGLQEKPFENTPDPRFLFQSQSTAEVYARLLYTLQSNRGAALLTGDTGCGKTLVARALLQQLDPEHTEIALLSTPSRSADEFLHELLYQLGEETDLTDRNRVVHRLNEVLYDYHAAGRQTVVVVEEGQLIEDLKILEEIRLLLNFQLNDAFLVTLLLVGQPPLADRVRRYAPLDQRVATRGFLRPLGREEVPAYVAHRLATAGRDQPIYTADALDLVYEYSEGVPRRVNNICDIALVIGFSRKLESIDADAMRRLIHAERGGEG
ncbi:MAG: AAA family ATPase [Gemmatimonadota bacterium]